MNVFRAPAAARAAKTLDRAVFASTLPATAALVRDNRLLSKYRQGLERTRELLRLERFSPIASHPDPALAREGKKCIVLNPDVKPAGTFFCFVFPCGRHGASKYADEAPLWLVVPETWSPLLKQGSESGDLTLVPFNVDIDYDLWSYSESHGLLYHADDLLMCWQLTLSGPSSLRSCTTKSLSASTRPAMSVRH
jgi:tRNA (guanine37-N1)-methyltransferase